MAEEGEGTGKGKGRSGTTSACSCGCQPEQILRSQHLFAPGAGRCFWLLWLALAALDQLVVLPGHRGAPPIAILIRQLLPRTDIPRQFTWTQVTWILSWHFVLLVTHIFSNLKTDSADEAR